VRVVRHAELTRELSAAVAAPAVIAQFSRLLVDANRPLDSPTLFRDTADGAPVHMNQGIALKAHAHTTAHAHAPMREEIASLHLVLVDDVVGLCVRTRAQTGLSEEEKEKRLQACYYPYHRALSELERKVMPDFILSLHSYTNNYEGQVRSQPTTQSARRHTHSPARHGVAFVLRVQPRVVEVGVLYDEDEDLAKTIRQQFIDQG
jgi:predicted N-formylglutamate amidohydrolase